MTYWLNTEPTACKNETWVQKQTRSALRDLLGIVVKQLPVLHEVLMVGLIKNTQCCSTLRIPWVIAVCLTDSIISVKSEEVTNGVTNLDQNVAPSPLVEAKTVLCMFFLCQSTWVVWQKKSWKSSRFPIYCQLKRISDAFISLHVMHLRPALEKLSLQTAGYMLKVSLWRSW